MPGPSNPVGALSPTAVSNSAPTPQQAAGRQSNSPSPQPFAKALDNRIKHHHEKQHPATKPAEESQVAADAEKKLIVDPATANPAEAAAIAAGMLAASVPVVVEEEMATVPIGEALEGEEGAKPILAVDTDGERGQRTDVPVVAPGAAPPSSGMPDRQDAQSAADQSGRLADTGRVATNDRDLEAAVAGPRLQDIASSKEIAGAKEAGSAIRTANLTASAEAQPAVPQFAEHLSARMAPVHKADAPQFQVPTPVGQRAWAEDIGNRIVWMAGKELGRAELILTPPHLGRVEISLALHGDQASASFVAATPAAREALEQALPKLRELMLDAGIDLSQTNVSANNTGRQDTPEQHWGARRSSTGGDAVGVDGDVVAGSAPLRSGNGLVDTFA